MSQSISSRFLRTGLPARLKTSLGLAAALGAATLVAGADARAASERWSFERARGGGFAQSCQLRRGQRICAVVYCGRGVDDWGLGLTGWNPRGRGPDERIAEVGVDGRMIQRTLELENDRFVGDVWRIATRRGGDRFVERIKDGGALTVDLGRRGRPLVFSLNGSHAAISQLEQRCGRIEARQAARRDDRGRGGDIEIAEGLTLDSEGFVIGNDDFQFRVELRDREKDGRLSRRQVRRLFNRRGFQRVTDIDYRPARGVYAVDGVNRRGVRVRVIIDAETGKFQRMRRL